MRQSAKLWKTKGGKKVRLRDLEDSHLINIINLMERTAQKLRDNALSRLLRDADFFQGKYERAYFNERKQNMYDDEEGEAFLHPLYNDFMQEKLRREVLKINQEKVSHEGH